MADQYFIEEIDAGNAVALDATALIPFVGTPSGTPADGAATPAEIAAFLAAASTTVAGKSELATSAETTTGTDTGRTITPDGLRGSDYGKRIICFQWLAPDGALTTGDGKAQFRVPAELNGWNIVGVAARVDTASTSGLPTFQVRRKRSGSSADVLSTAITIDENETDSSTAATAAAINTSNDDLATADVLYVDADVAGTGTAGPQVQVIVQKPGA